MKQLQITTKVNLALLLLLTTLMVPQWSFSQITIKRDPRIETATQAISTASLQNTIENLVKFHTRHNLSTQNRADIGIGAASLYIEQKLNELSVGREDFVSIERVRYRAGGSGSRLEREIWLPNIIATIKGSNLQDNRVIIMLAHYDSRTENNNDSTAFAPGANDNGSGVATLMENATILAQNRLPVTVKIMFLSGEEHGLLGAAHMAKIAREENWNVIAVINNDMISNSQSSDTDIRNNTKLRVFSENIPFVETEQEAKERVYNSSQNDSPSRQLARYIKETGERYTPNLKIELIYRIDRFGRGGDHTPFCKEGFTAVRVCEYYENYDRTHKITETINGKEFGDVIKGVDFEYLRKNSVVNLSTVMNLAYAPAAPNNVYTDASELSNYSKISWKAPTVGIKPAGYYLLIRETDKSQWERKIFVEGESAEVPYSKDNYFFAVQAVSEAGNESIAVFSKGKR
ncbi:MAG: M20/M25/M40 family metallo-hydrolase [Dysgonamonadaceae bacterium]